MTSWRCLESLFYVGHGQLFPSQSWPVILCWNYVARNNNIMVYICGRRGTFGLTKILCRGLRVKINPRDKIILFPVTCPWCPICTCDGILALPERMSETSPIYHTLTDCQRKGLSSNIIRILDFLAFQKLWENFCGRWILLHFSKFDFLEYFYLPHLVEKYCL